MRESRQRWASTWLGAPVAGIALLTAAAPVGCAATPTGAPRVTQPGDFKMLAGPWTGSAYVQQAQSIAIQGVIQETDAFYIVPRGAPGPSSRGR
jgi:hypothetical protein